MAPDFDSLFADDTPITPQEQSWGGFDYWKLLARENNEPAIKEVLEHIDVLVDWKFVLEKKNLKLAFRGSENQRLVNYLKII